MRFKSSIRNIQTFTKFASSLSSLGKVAWVRLDDDQIRFTIIPEQGTQVWAVLSIDSIFETYTIQSASPNNTINLELPIIPLHRALRSALGANSANLRLTKKDNVPLLSLTIVTNSISSGPSAGGWGRNGNPLDQNEDDEMADLGGDGQVRETVVTQDIPIRVLSPASVEGIHEPRCREPDVHITLPNLFQLKSISERFTKLATATSTTGSERGMAGAAGAGPKLVLSANMHGSLRLGVATDALSISSVWTGLVNPELDPSHVEGGEDGIRVHPSTRMRELGGEGDGGEEGWARVRIDGKDWGRVLSVGRLGGRVIACAYFPDTPVRDF
ncbi:hypothetical protein FGG08_003161 [Glutinoglossum americanum]|uniref:Checkpoint protein n=1 Tax=Glutinoglossum americanum TaxID=1670608 RepID=A0A9P8HYT3_9PEZI|nr:hypothetical protein FGG08_003161 [Glutinoglossum americanum]